MRKEVLLYILYSYEIEVHELRENSSTCRTHHWQNFNASEIANRMDELIGLLILYTTDGYGHAVTSMSNERSNNTEVSEPMGSDSLKGNDEAVAKTMEYVGEMSNCLLVPYHIS